MFHLNLFLAYILRASTAILKNYLLMDGFALYKDLQYTEEELGFKDESSVSEGSITVTIAVTSLSWNPPPCDTLKGKHFDISWHVCLNKKKPLNILVVLVFLHVVIDASLKTKLYHRDHSLKFISAYLSLSLSLSLSLFCWPPIYPFTYPSICPSIIVIMNCFIYPVALGVQTARHLLCVHAGGKHLLVDPWCSCVDEAHRRGP